MELLKCAYYVKNFPTFENYITDNLQIILKPLPIFLIVVSTSENNTSLKDLVEATIHEMTNAEELYKNNIKFGYFFLKKKGFMSL